MFCSGHLFWKELSKTLTDRINLASSLVCNENTCKTLFRSMAAKWLIGSGGTNTAAEMKCKKLRHLLIYSECFVKNFHKMFSQLHTLYNAILRIARNFLETRGNIQNGRLKKSSFFKIANSQKIFAKISQICPWVSRIEWCKGHRCSSTYMAVRLSNKSSKTAKKCFFGTFWLFLSFCRTASRPYA